MTQRIEAIFVNGMFRPVGPVSLTEGQRVSLQVDPPNDDLQDLRDLLDTEYMSACCQRADAPSLQEVRQILKRVPESLADAIAEERDER